MRMGCAPLTIVIGASKLISSSGAFQAIAA